MIKKFPIMALVFFIVLLANEFSFSDEAQPANPPIFSALWPAVNEDNLDKVKAIIETDPKAVNAINLDGETPLVHIAKEAKVNLPSDHFNPVDIMKNPQIQDNLIVSPVAKLLVEKGADVNAKGNLDGTPLLFAVNNRNVGLAEYLINNGADINAKIPDGRTALYLAIFLHENSIVELLIKKGADIKTEVVDYGTPLKYAIDNKKDDIAEFLRQHGGHE